MNIDRRSFLGGTVAAVISASFNGTPTKEQAASRLGNLQLRLMRNRALILPLVPLKVENTVLPTQLHISATWLFDYTISKLFATHCEVVSKEGVVCVNRLSRHNQDWLRGITFLAGETLTIDSAINFD